MIVWIDWGFFCFMLVNGALGGPEWLHSYGCHLVLATG